MELTQLLTFPHVTALHTPAGAGVTRHRGGRRPLACGVRLMPGPGGETLKSSGQAWLVGEARGENH